mgnify:CR=1 FL=1
MNVEGEKLIYAKYDELMYDETKKVLIAGKEDNGMSWKYINEEDEQLSSETFTRALDFSILDGKHTIVKPDDHIYALINSEYEMLKGQPDMVDISLSEGCNWIGSDYIDFNEFIAKLQLKQNSIFGLSLQSKPVDVANLNSQWDEYFEPDPRLHGYLNKLAMRRSLDYTHLELEVLFDDIIGREVEDEGMPIEDEDLEVADGPCEWTDAKPQKIELNIEKTSKLNGKMDTLFGMIADIYKKGAAIVKQNNNALLLKCKDGSVCAVVRDFNSITISIISATYAADFLEGFSIDKYDGPILEGDFD